MKKTIKPIALLLAAAMTLCFSACGKTEKRAEFMSAGQKYETWKDIPLDTVIAKLKSGESPEAFNITFGDFYSEYLYYLKSYDIDDDMSEENSDECAAYRSDIVNYLTFERIMLYVAEHEFGITEDTLTGEQKQEILDNSAETLENWKGNYRGKVESVLGYELTEAEINDKTEKLLEDDLMSCGFTKDIFYQWEYNAYIQQLVAERLNEQAEASDEDVENMYNSYYDEALDMYNSDKAAYEDTPLYQALYMPKGARKASHIFIPFDNDEAEDDSDDFILKADESAESTENELSDSSDENSDNGEDAAKAPARPLPDAVNEVAERLRGGEDFYELQEEYSPDDAGEITVIPESELLPAEYLKALMALGSQGDISEPVVCARGVYFIKYESDAVISSEETAELKENMREYLTEMKQQQLQMEKYDEWMTLYEYEIDEELLKIDDPSMELPDLDGAIDYDELPDGLEIITE